MENYSERDLNLDKARVLYNRQNKIIIYHTRLSNGKEIVVKKQMISNLDEGNNLLREGYAMALLHHHSIIKIHSTLLGGSIKGAFDYILLIMDYYPEGDLENEIKRRISLNEKWNDDELNLIFFNLIEGFAYMQENNIAHRDIKPQNILKNGNIYVISDFGNAFKTEKKLSDIAGTPAYLSPNLRKAYQNYHKGFSLENFDHNAFKSDVFSLGLVFLYMASLESILDLATTDETVYLENLAKKINRLTCNQEIIYLIGRMLAFNEENRPDFLDVADYYNLNTNACSIEIKDKKIESDLPKSGINMNYFTNVTDGNQNNIVSYSENNSYNGYAYIYDNPNTNYINRIENQQFYNPDRIQGFENYYSSNNYYMMNQVLYQFQNCDILREFKNIISNPLKMNFKWKVWVNEEYLKNKILENMKKWMIELDESSLSIVMKLKAKFRICIWEFYYKCKICDSPIMDIQTAKKSSCLGYLHVDCIKKCARYYRDNSYISINFYCITCTKMHCFDFKYFNLCQNCHIKCTYFKHFVNNYICLDCLKYLSGFPSYYIQLSTYFTEMDGNQYDLCFYCNSFAELLNNESFQVCYNCAINLLENMIFKNKEVIDLNSLNEESNCENNLNTKNIFSDPENKPDEAEEKSRKNIFNDPENKLDEAEEKSRKNIFSDPENKPDEAEEKSRKNSESSISKSNIKLKSSKILNPKHSPKFIVENSEILNPKHLPELTVENSEILSPKHLPELIVENSNTSKDDILNSLKHNIAPENLENPQPTSKKSLKKNNFNKKRSSEKNSKEPHENTSTEIETAQEKIDTKSEKEKYQVNEKIDTKIVKEKGEEQKKAKANTNTKPKTNYNVSIKKSIKKK
ncbi:hypothetical protein SteCoe_30764 [Stentor coeruleus]|uniref:non-specific serine/threonine protein kinase n=1 Tax=Stentor coeruleus TaxID=5963 RepID=A0A1R2B2U0_9CILI|nr:hypothetical protein SteCoe_30764 [Stentor coeruleus]